MFENYIFIRNYLILAYMYFSREILSPVQQPRWTHLVVTCTSMTFMVVSCKQIKSHEGELEWTHASTKVTPVSCKHPLRAQYWGESAKW